MMVCPLVPLRASWKEWNGLWQTFHRAFSAWINWSRWKKLSRAGSFLWPRSVRGVCLHLISLPLSPSLSPSLSPIDYIKFLSLHIYPQYEPIHIWSQKYTLQANSDFFYFHLQNCWRWDCFIGTRSYMTYMLYWSLLEKQGFCQFYCKRVWRPDTFTFLFGQCLSLRISYAVPKGP